LIHWGVVLIGFFTELIIEFYPELPSKLNYLRRLGEEKTRVINKILAAIINVPVTALLLLALLASLFK